MRWTFEINFRPDHEQPTWICALRSFPTSEDAASTAGKYLAVHYEEHGTCPAVRLREMPD